MNTMKCLIALTVVLSLSILSSAAPSDAPGHMPDARMLRFPDISSNKIVFSYAGDLWTVPREGGAARRLSSPRGNEMFPKFSPDGSLIAFSGNYDGNTDVYIVGAEGGSPTPADPPSRQRSGRRMVPRRPARALPLAHGQFFGSLQPVLQTVHRWRPASRRLPLPYGELASFSPDGSRIAFQFISRELRNWKRYRGGMASDLWLYDFLNNSSEKLTDFARHRRRADVARGHDLLPLRPGRQRQAQHLGLRTAQQAIQAGDPFHRVRRQVAQSRARRDRLSRTAGSSTCSTWPREEIDASGRSRCPTICLRSARS